MFLYSLIGLQYINEKESFLTPSRTWVLCSHSSLTPLWEGKVSYQGESEMRCLEFFMQLGCTWSWLKVPDITTSSCFKSNMEKENLVLVLLSQKKCFNESDLTFIKLSYIKWNVLKWEVIQYSIFIEDDSYNPNGFVWFGLIGPRSPFRFLIAH